MRDVAIVAFAQSGHSGTDSGHNEVELLTPVVNEVLDRAGITRDRIGFTCSGSCDYLAGAPFSFVAALDAIGAWPPIAESHVEQDGAWALYEAWVRLQHGDVDIALVYGFGKSTPGDLAAIHALQLDPYYLTPLWPSHVSLAALQARAYLDASGKSARDLAEIAVRSRAAGHSNPYALDLPALTIDEALAESPSADPLRPSDCPPATDGAAAVILASGETARALCEHPAWIRGIDHRIEPHSIGVRDLTRSTSASTAARKAGLDGSLVDVVELHARFSHEELILREAFELSETVTVNPSGGPLAADPVMATGLIRIGEAARHIHEGAALRTAGHAASGPCLQHNLVCVLEREGA